MEYLNIPISVICSVEYVGSKPAERATWLNLAGYCAIVENGGKIDGARAWKDRRCQQVLGITRRELLTECELWSFDGEDLHVHFYPIEQEAKVIAKRGVARTNGKLGGRPKKTEPGSETETQGEPNSVPISEPNLKPKSESVKERKGKEGKEIERERVREDDLATHAQQIVGSYPRREKLADALGIVLGHLREGADPEAMLAGTRAAAVVIEGAPSGHLNKFVPSAVNFFRSKRWQDDPATLIRPPSAPNGTPMTDDELALQIGGRNLDY